MTDLFKEVVPSILQTKKHTIFEENEKEYVPYVVNRALSFHKDCVLFANEMNRLPNTDKLLQYHFLINTIRGYKRPFQKWIKQESIEDLEYVKEFYNFSTEKAREALSILTKDQIDEIKKHLNKGGLSNDKTRRTSRSNTS
jgi:hypothetical protein